MRSSVQLKGTFNVVEDLGVLGRVLDRVISVAGLRIYTRRCTGCSTSNMEHSSQKQQPPDLEVGV